MTHYFTNARRFFSCKARNHSTKLVNIEVVVNAWTGVLPDLALLYIPYVAVFPFFDFEYLSGKHKPKKEVGQNSFNILQRSFTIDE